ncbi:MAG TPA: hypothetical protein VLH94_00765 [Spirochaetia bacterium]|nr:hypothetical protein [Spirochaetia bacterium]
MMGGRIINMSYTIEKTKAGKDIVVSGWEYGISNNPYTGIYDMRNIDPSSIQGEVGVAMSTENMQSQGKITTVAFTCDHTTDVFTYDGVVPLLVNTAIVFQGSDLPNGLTQNTKAYYILTTPTPTTFTISSVSAGGAQQLVSDNGTGVMTFSTINMGIPTDSCMLDITVGGGRRLYFLGDNKGRIWVRDGQFMGATYQWVYMHNRASEASSADENTFGLIGWKNYLFWFDSDSLNVFRLVDYSFGTPITPSLPFLTTSSWIEDWQNLDVSVIYSTMSHHALIDSQRDAVYFCNGSSIGTLSEIDGALFGLSATATINDGVTVAGDNTITTVSNFFTNNMIGCEIVGAGIPTGAIITKINNSKSAEVDLNHTPDTDDTGVTFTITQSYQYTSTAISIPDNDVVTCLEELNGQILIGGMNNRIYPWDKLSQGYGTPIFLSENMVACMVTVNTTTYIFCGERGNIYQTNGSNVAFYKNIPIQLSETLNPMIIWTDAIYNRNMIYLGFQAKTNSGTTINEYGGLWAIDLATDAIFMSNQMSYGTYNGYTYSLLQYKGESVSFPNPTISTTGPFGNNQGYELIIGWYNGTDGGVDKCISAPYTGGQSYVITDMIPVGLYLTPRAFTNLEFKLSTPLVTGESVALYYRKNITEDFVPVPITQGGGVGELSGIATTTFENIQWIQLKAVLTSTATNPSYCRLRELRIR